MANYYSHLADTIKVILEDNARNLSKNIVQSYAKQRKEALKKCYEIRKICYGEDHPLTQSTRPDQPKS